MKEKTPLNLVINSFLNSFLESKNSNIYSKQKLIALKDLIQNKPVDKVEEIITSFWAKFLNGEGSIQLKKRGVFTTPKEIVNFMIQGVDILLRTHFDRPKGILDSKVTYFDPSCGPMTFPQGLMEHAEKKLNEFNFKHKNTRNGFNEWFHNEFLPNMISFEIMEEPYVVGYIKSLILACKLGADLKSTYQFKFYQGNTIIEIERKFPLLKTNNQPLVVMGNPPYNVSSQTHSMWINKAMSTYKSNLSEKNIQPLSDDYVKFIRIAQWLIEENKTGIVAFITNNTWLESRIFRIMRKELSQTFNYIYIANLHGNVRKRQKGNPFDIMVGVCIVFFVRSTNQPYNKINILYRDISIPSKQGKLQALTEGFNLSLFQSLTITPEYLFIPIKVNSHLLARYQKFVPLDHLFKHIVSGIKTHRDKFLVNTEQKQLQQNIRSFFKNEQELKDQGIYLHSTRDWPKKRVQKSDILEAALSDIIIEGYRGFDSRFLCYNESLVEPGCSRRNFMQNITKENPAICVTKQLLTIPFNHAFITDKPFDICFLSTNSKESAYGLIRNHNGNSNLRIPKLPYKVDEEEVFNYIYGILNSSVFRLRYEEYLVRNFPCIPFTEDEVNFKAMSRIGEKIVNLHLLKSPTLNPSRFPINKEEEWRIINFRYDQELQRIYIQSSKVRKLKSSNWIGNITPKMWQYRIGNLPQLGNWLKARKNNRKHQKNQITNPLNEREIQQFLTICDSISQTLDLLPEINKIYEKIDP